MTRDGSESDPPAGSSDRNADETASRLSLPDGLRGDLKDPFGPIESDADALLSDVSGPLIAVGDVVTYHLLQAGRPPDVALVDGITKRTAVADEIADAVTTGANYEVVNPPATITPGLIDALIEAIADDDPTTILVDGEEDLAALPAIVLAPDGASVVYGQPDEGMVHVVVDAEVRARVAGLLRRFEGDPAVLDSILDR